LLNIENKTIFYPPQEKSFHPKKTELMRPPRMWIFTPRTECATWHLLLFPPVIKYSKCVNINYYTFYAFHKI